MHKSLFSIASTCAMIASCAKANYRSGEVRSFETFSYGRFSTRIQGSGKPGTVGSFFTYWTGPNWSVEGWNEIDVEIVPSIYDDPMSMNIIWE